MFLALREMRHAKLRYALMAAILILVSFLVLFVTGLARGLSYANASSVVHMPADGFVLSADAEHRLARSELDAARTERIGELAGAGHAEALGVRMATVAVDGGGKADAAVLAVDPDGWLAPPVAEGAPLGPDDTGLAVADAKLKDAGARIGGVMTDASSGRSWKIIGFTEEQSFSHTPALFVSPAEWEQLAQSARGGTGAEGGEPAFNAIALQGDRERLEAIAAEMPDAVLLSKQQVIEAIPGYSAEQGSLTMMIAFLYVISAFVLAVFFYVMTLQKLGQFGILKAIGARTGYLARSVAGQVLLIAAASLAASLLLIAGFRAVLPDALPFRLDESTLLATCALFLATSAAGSLLSVIKVARADALEAIGRSAA
ncbi:ABC transporter permease [Paenibacillus albicereus]|uniref:Putative hemin transport system permease protein HrtB n=1 Tax=Paenibacillus albicereus TaxID=2726185 RepID=A0A6H2GVV8_9BACL|nr:ABC transporter permease [Paenibacillus albicereus]QJC51550.1 ABC transporter permease [Paenibacillus albicereus]